MAEVSDSILEVYVIEDPVIVEELSIVIEDLALIENLGIKDKTQRPAVNRQKLVKQTVSLFSLFNIFYLFLSSFKSDIFAAAW